MNMLVTIHNMLQQPAFNPQLPQPWGNTVKADEQSHLVVRPSATEIAAYPPLTRASPPTMVASEMVHRAAEIPAKPSSRSLSRSLSSLPSQLSKPSSQSKHQAQQVGPYNDMSGNANASSASSLRLAEHGKPETLSLWSTNDSYLPRAKPPPPLKQVKHRRGHSEELDTQKYDSPVDQNHEPVIQPGCTLTRLASRASDVSRASSVSDISFALSNVSDVSFAPSRFGSSWKWKPPVSWAGPQPSRSASVCGRPLGGFLPGSKKSVERGGIQDGSDGHTQADLKHVRSLRRLWSLRLTDVGVPREPLFRTQQGSSDLRVKVQVNEGDRWHEREIVDVIPMLRELREG